MKSRSEKEHKWTREQKKAIFLRGSDILVAAGAGSGKTRVLVERIIQKITDPAKPVALDRLLVVTFTKAAASEMRRRIGVALKEKLQENPRSANLHRQMLLLNQASITTVHSFCLDVIRQYYYLQGLDPSFRVLDGTAAEQLRQETLEELLDKYYDTMGPETPFYRLVEAYSSDRGDQGLQSLVLRLSTFARSHPFPDLWLRQSLRAFLSGFAGGGNRNPWTGPLLKEFRAELKMAIESMQEMLLVVSSPGGPAPYLDSLNKELVALREMREAADRGWESLFSCMQRDPFGRLKPCKGDAYDEVLKEQVKKGRDEIKKDLRKLKEDYFTVSLEEQFAFLERYEPLLTFLVELVGAFNARYQQAKREKGVADFSDLEHYALQILNDAKSAPGTLLPSKAAREYRHYFKEILIDEYQDINQVQEAILALVSTSEPLGNRFMVGDVKQSIYRFRLAEPALFLQKQHSFGQGSSPGRCVHLNKNFRSRMEILEGTNYLFGRIMDEVVGEINYDQEARLYYGGLYPPPCIDENSRDRGSGETIDFLLIDRQGPGFQGGGNGVFEGGGEGPEDGEAEELEILQAEWETASLEGRLIARQIKKLMGEQGDPHLPLYDKKNRNYRRVAYRDIAILLRSAVNYAPAIAEELQRAGIPAYAELSGGFFDATEVKVMLSLLRIIDNPYQDLPLAAVLRSPILGLKAGDLALIRTAAPSASFFDALLLASADRELLPSPLRRILLKFLDNLEGWQKLAIHGTIVDLIRQIYRETGYYDLAGGMPGGKQRQANLQALYDRAKAYETLPSRGLFRYLSFLEKLKERGEDLKPACAHGEQEDVVRILTVHKSKGLEFPVVFLAGLSKKFNQKDLQHHFLLHKELGFGPKYIDTQHRFILPTLPWYAIRKRLHAELLAEEMRILYVAMTRAEQKLFLLATVKDLKKELFRWQMASRPAPQPLPQYYRARAECYLDWIGPALWQHPVFCGQKNGRQRGKVHSTNAAEDGLFFWDIALYTSTEIMGPASEEDTVALREEEKRRQERLDRIRRWEPLTTTGGEETAAKITKRLSWQYPRQWAPRNYAKIAVSELPKLRDAGLTESGEGTILDEIWGPGPPAYFRRPRFLGEKVLSAAERGTAYHTAMQHLKLTAPLDRHAISEQLQKMLAEGHLDPGECCIIDPGLIADFLATPLGERIIEAYPRKLWRELPF
ncbi:MAG TPA: UvrD-helicase domain-containing protein, partial [Firmicutes bacterium]|nr:UvrD-helicase domain-containing protein [Bacillota bacterium]